VAEWRHDMTARQLALETLTNLFASDDDSEDGEGGDADNNAGDGEAEMMVEAGTHQGTVPTATQTQVCLCM
jgi:hypothetical protein